MRDGFALFALCTLIAGCQQEPDFDARYDEHSREIEKQARTIDETVDQRLKAAQEAESALGETVDLESTRSDQEQ